MRALARRSCWLGLLCLLVTSGCGGPGDLSGTVTYKGKPLSTGTVNVVGGDGIICSGIIQDDGTFTVTGLVPGKVQIAVTSINPAKQKSIAKPKSGMEVAPKGDGSKWFAIPEQYADFERSGLTFDLERGPNSFPIELK